MASLLNQAFQMAKNQNRPALLTYTVAGDSSKKQSLAILKSISKNADILEVGVPHNTPVADGSQIQTSAYRAIKNGIKINDIFQIVKDFKKSEKSKPIIFLAFFNRKIVFFPVPQPSSITLENSSLLNVSIVDLVSKSLVLFEFVSYWSAQILYAFSTFILYSNFLYCGQRSSV